MPTGTQLRQHLEDFQGRIAEEVSAIDRDVLDLQRVRQALSEEIAAEARVLGAVYLPSLDPAALTEAGQRTGFRGFAKFDPIAAMARERRVLEHRIAEIAASEAYQRREWLVGPHGSITQRLAEAEGLLAPWEAECARFERLDAFLELYAAKYDTPEFDRRWWQPSYWRLWAAGDRICGALGLNDFGDDVLPAYEKARKPREDWRAQVAGIQAERQKVLDLVRERDDAVHRLQNIESIYLDEAQQALAAHLQGADFPLLESWAGDDRAVIVSLRKLAGLHAKGLILDDLVRSQEGAKAQWQARSSQVHTKVIKLSRPKKAGRSYPDTELPHKGLAALERSRQARAKVRGLSDRVVRYDKYDRFDLQGNAPELWYQEMVGRPAGRYTPSLAPWYAHHPSVTVVHLHDHGAPGELDLHAIPDGLVDDAHSAMGDIS